MSRIIKSKTNAQSPARTRGWARGEKQTLVSSSNTAVTARGRVTIATDETVFSTSAVSGGRRIKVSGILLL